MTDLKLNGVTIGDGTLGTSDADWAKGLHLYGETFSDFEITGDVTFSWSAGTTPSNSEMATFIGWSNTTAVPEPATIFLVGLGLVGAAGMSRRIRKK